MLGEQRLLQLAGMRAACDEIVSVGVKRQQGVEKGIGALLQGGDRGQAGARRVEDAPPAHGNSQMGIAKLPLAKELADLDFAGTPINGELVEQLSTGGVLDEQSHVVLIGGTGTGESDIAFGIARSVIRAGRKARFFNAVDRVNKLEAEMTLERRPRITTAIRPVRLDSVRGASRMQANKIFLLCHANQCLAQSWI